MSNWKNRITGHGTIKIAEVLFNPLNWRIHPKQQYEAILGAMREIGWVGEVLINTTTGNLVDGHLRILSAERDGETDAPVTYIEVSEEEERKILMTLDPISSMAGTDPNKLQYLIDNTDIKDAGLQEMLARMAAKNNMQTDDDQEEEDIPETEHDMLVKKWGAEPGQLWQLGRHRLICGDSTDPEVWKKLMRNEKADLVFTDPPYGVDYAAKKRNNPLYKEDKDYYKIKNDELVENELIKMLKNALQNAMENTIDQAAFYIWHGATTRKEFEYVLDTIGLEEKQYIVWIKDHFSPGWSDYQWQTEPCFYCQKWGSSTRFYGNRGQATVWQISRVSGQEAAITIANGLKISDGEHQPIYIGLNQTKAKIRHIRINKDQEIRINLPGETDAWQIARKEQGEGYYHPTQKPTALAMIGIRNSSLPDQIVLDPFIGGGMTLLACEKANRRCNAIDLDPKWIAVVLERWSRMTNQKPNLLTETSKKETAPQNAQEGH